MKMIATSPNKNIAILTNILSMMKAIATMSSNTAIEISFAMKEFVLAIIDL